tara:strand:+ start:250 stop:591 length:342 start_codon:yes stop_codon:yes gene_type:complete
LTPLLAEGTRLSSAIRKALPNTRWGSSTDHYEYKRCSSAVQECKKFILENAKAFKQAKQWECSRDYCVRMAPVAESMVRFDVESDTKVRTMVIEQLKKFREEAEKKWIFVPAL